MTIEQLLNKINRPYEKQSEKSYIVALEDSDDYARVYTLLDNLEDSYVTVSIADDKTTCNFIFENYKLVLLGDLSADEYSLTIEVLEE